MINYSKEIKSQLETILPTYYELFVDDSIKAPCITYKESNNIAQEESEKLRYAYTIFQIKVWAKHISDIKHYVSLVDDLMFTLGYKRIAFDELSYNGLICEILRYQGLSKEQLTIIE